MTLFFPFPWCSLALGIKKNSVFFCLIDLPTQEHEYDKNILHRTGKVREGKKIYIKYKPFNLSSADSLI